MKRSDSLERRKKVIELVINSFLSKRVDRRIFCDKHYILWIDADEDVYEDLTSENSDKLTLLEELKDVLFTKKDIVLGSILIRRGKPEDLSEEIKKEDVEDGVVIYLEKTTVKPSAPQQGKLMKARITLAPGSPGGLKRPKGYVIDSEHSPYNIGRVIEPSNSINRVNHIEIIDETNHVSRIQAHIGFVDQYGFFIQLDRNESWDRHERTKTNRTKVIRKGKKMSLDSLPARLFLKDGDMIELSYYVTLLFNELNKNK